MTCVVPLAWLQCTASPAEGPTLMVALLARVWPAAQLIGEVLAGEPAQVERAPGRARRARRGQPARGREAVEEGRLGQASGDVDGDGARCGVLVEKQQVESTAVADRVRAHLVDVRGRGAHGVAG